MVKLTATIGTTFALSLSCKDSAGDPVNLTGYTARGLIKTTLESENTVYDLSPSIATPASGIVTALISAEDTQGIDPDSYVWSIVLDTPSSATICIGSGTIVFRRTSTPFPITP